MKNRFFINGSGWNMSGTKMASILVAVLLVLPQLSAVHSQPMVGDYLIGPNGDYETFSAAMADLMERKIGGDILFEVEPGFYNERLNIGWIQLPNYQISPYDVVFRSLSENPEDVVLRAGGGSAPNYVVSMHINSRNVSFINFTIESTNSNTQLIEVNGHGHNFIGMVFRNGDLFGAHHSRGLVVENNVFHNSAIRFIGSGTVGNFRIENNWFNNGRITVNNIRVAPVIIANNVILATHDAIYARGNREPIHIYNNYIRVEGNSNRNGIWLHETDSVVVYHNTVKTYGHGTTFWSTNWGNHNLKNNIFFSTIGRPIDIRDPEQVTLSADYNGYYTMGPNIARVGGVEYSSWEGYRSLMEQDQNSINTDPVFDFTASEEREKMKPGSSIYATGGMDASDIVPYDLMGAPRNSTPSLGALEFIGTDTSIPQPEGTGLPGSFLLADNYPNPFNPVTTIRYNLPEPAEITVAVYDIHGRHIAILVSGRQEAGSHSAIFNATNLASGVYVYRITANTQSRSGKMLLVK